MRIFTTTAYATTALTAGRKYAWRVITHDGTTELPSAWSEEFVAISPTSTATLDAIGDVSGGAETSQVLVYDGTEWRPEDKTTINGLSGAVSLQPGDNVQINKVGQAITIDAVIPDDAGIDWLANVPANSADAGAAGEVAFDADYLYIYTGTKWRRVALQDFGTPPPPETGGLIVIESGDSLVTEAGDALATEDSTGAITPTITITSDPTTQYSLLGMATFTVEATVDTWVALSYQWQSDGGINNWQDIAGNASARTATFTATGLTTQDNNTLYRVKVSAAGASAVISKAALLVVEESVEQELVTIPQYLDTANTASSLQASLDPALTALGTPSYQWEVSYDGKQTWAPLTNQTGDTYYSSANQVAVRAALNDVSWPFDRDWRVPDGTPREGSYNEPVMRVRVTVGSTTVYSNSSWVTSVRADNWLDPNDWQGSNGTLNNIQLDYVIDRSQGLQLPPYTLPGLTGYVAERSRDGGATWTRLTSVSEYNGIEGLTTSANVPPITDVETGDWYRLQFAGNGGVYGPSGILGVLLATYGISSRISLTSATVASGEIATFVANVPYYGVPLKAYWQDSDNGGFSYRTRSIIYPSTVTSSGASVFRLSVGPVDSTYNGRLYRLQFRPDTVTTQLFPGLYESSPAVLTVT